MQYRPTATELLETIAALLADEVVDALHGPVQHKVRVAANVASILAREAEVAPANADREARLTRALLDLDGTDATPLAELRLRLATALRSGELPGRTDDEVWESLLQITRDDLTIAKPGHDSWTGDDWTRS
jgi:hypothetical protein